MAFDKYVCCLLGGIRRRLTASECSQTLQKGAVAVRQPLVATRVEEGPQSLGVSAANERECLKKGFRVTGARQSVA